MVASGDDGRWQPAAITDSGGWRWQTVGTGSDGWGQMMAVNGRKWWQTGPTTDDGGLW